jgi:hypothetical protein
MASTLRIFASNPPNAERPVLGLSVIEVREPMPPDEPELGEGWLLYQVELPRHRAMPVVVDGPFTIVAPEYCSNAVAVVHADELELALERIAPAREAVDEPDTLDGLVRALAALPEVDRILVDDAIDGEHPRGFDTSDVEAAIEQVHRLLDDHDRLLHRHRGR